MWPPERATRLPRTAARPWFKCDDPSPAEFARGLRPAVDTVFADALLDRFLMRLTMRLPKLRGEGDHRPHVYRNAVLAAFRGPR